MLLVRFFLVFIINKFVFLRFKIFKHTLQELMSRAFKASRKYLNEDNLEKFQETIKKMTDISEINYTFMESIILI